MEDTHSTAGLPIRSELIARAEFLELAAILPARLNELIELGWVEPVVTPAEAMLFRQVDVYRIRKLERICVDFELPSVGGIIIVDLLDRIDTLDSRIRELEVSIRR